MNWKKIKLYYLNFYSVSYYELSIDGSEGAKQKSSGVIAYTGTGSTSW